MINWKPICYCKINLNLLNNEWGENKMIKRLNVKYVKVICLLLSFVMLFTLFGCSNNESVYDDNSKIAFQDNFSVISQINNISDDKRSFSSHISHLNGCFEVAEADIKGKCDVEICFSGDIKSGKAKIVLVKPDNKVEILKEVVAGQDNSYSYNLNVSCDVGLNKVKFVGKNYIGNFELSPKNEKVFDYIGSQFDKNFPFGDDSEENSSSGWDLDSDDEESKFNFSKFKSD